MIATLLRLAGINANVKYEICSWQSGQKNTSWIAPGGGGVSIYIYIVMCNRAFTGTKTKPIHGTFAYANHVYNNPFKVAILYVLCQLKVAIKTILEEIIIFVISKS